MRAPRYFIRRCRTGAARWPVWYVMDSITGHPVHWGGHLTLEAAEAELLRRREANDA